MNKQALLSFPGLPQTAHILGVISGDSSIPTTGPLPKLF